MWQIVSLFSCSLPQHSTGHFTVWSWLFHTLIPVLFLCHLMSESFAHLYRGYRIKALLQSKTKALKGICCCTGTAVCSIVNNLHKILVISMDKQWGKNGRKHHGIQILCRVGSNVLAMQRCESWSYKISEAHKLSYILKTFSKEIGKAFGNRNCHLHRIVSQLLVQIV